MAILFAVLVVACVTATNDYSKEQQFRSLSAINDDVLVKVALRLLHLPHYFRFFHLPFFHL